MRLFEKHRPKTWPEVLGQPKALAVIDRIEEGAMLP